jgi:hypothetical protein
VNVHATATVVPMATASPAAQKSSHLSPRRIRRIRDSAYHEDEHWRITTISASRQVPKYPVFSAALAGSALYVDDNLTVRNVLVDKKGTTVHFRHSGVALVDIPLCSTSRPYAACFRLHATGLGASVGMASSSTMRDNILGSQPDSVALHTDGTRGLCYLHGKSQQLVTPLSAGDVVRLEVNALNTLSISLRGSVVMQTEVPTGWHLAVGGLGANAKSPDEQCGTIWELENVVPLPSMHVTSAGRGPGTTYIRTVQIGL